jgi:hypothetical protein
LIPNGIVQKCTFAWYQEKHVSTCKISTKVSHNITGEESMLRDGFLCGRGGEAGAHRLESNTPRKMAKNNVKKLFEHFCHAKMFRWGRTFF